MALLKRSGLSGVTTWIASLATVSSASLIDCVLSADCRETHALLTGRGLFFLYLVCKSDLQANHAKYMTTRVYQQ